MGQILVKADGLKLDVDRTFTNGEIPPRQVVMGGGRIALSEGMPGSPPIHMRGKAFFYDNGEAVTDPAHVQHLPERSVIGGKICNPRSMALEFIEQQAGGKLHRADNPRAVRKPDKSNRGKKIELKGSDVLGQRGGTRAERVTDPDRET